MSLFQQQIAMDLGTANTRIYVKGKGVVVDEPSWVALDKGTRRVIATGSEARDFAGRHDESCIPCRPLRNGAIQDLESASSMIKTLLRKALKRVPIVLPRVLLVVPMGIRTHERRVLVEAARNAGAGKVYLLYAPIAAAIGMGLPLARTRGCMVVDMGCGSTEVALMCKDAVISGESLRIGGDEIDQSIYRYIRERYRIEISSKTAEEIKIRIGSASALSKESSFELRGRDLSAGMPEGIAVTDTEIRHAMRRPLTAIVDAVRRALEKASTELVEDICKSGIWLTGGIALLKGWNDLLYEQAGLEAQVANDPLRSAILGAGATIEQLRGVRDIFRIGKTAGYARAFSLKEA